MPFEERKTKLLEFLEAFYFKNKELFLLHICMLHLAVRRIPSGKILFLLGNGGDGKSMSAVLDKCTIGQNNYGNLDFGVFQDKNEFRKSTKFAVDKV